MFLHYTCCCQPVDCLAPNLFFLYSILFDIALRPFNVVFLYFNLANTFVLSSLHRICLGVSGLILYRILMMYVDTGLRNVNMGGRIREKKNSVHLCISDKELANGLRLVQEITYAKD